jgi:sugar lactone lactonase YvrE
MIAVLITGITSAFAFAAAPEGPGDVPPPWVTQAALDAALGGASGLPEVSTNPDAAEGVDLEDLSRSEAGDLLTGVFGEVLEQPGGVYDELDVIAFHSDYAAVVPSGAEGEGSGRSLLASTLPLRAEGEDGTSSAVSLDLEAVDGELQVANPLVEIEIPENLGEGIEIPEAGVTIALAGAPVGREPNAIDGGSAFYPNVAPESDLAVVPTPTGFETFTQLRSEEAPTTQVFELDLPAGAVLFEDGLGGAAVKQGGDLLMAVHPPTAIDADGHPVAVGLAVDGGTIKVVADPPESAAYPILVDPIFESYMWIPNNSGAGIFWEEEWKSVSSHPLLTKSALSNWNQQLYFGPSLQSKAGALPSGGAQVVWYYTVPRYETDPGPPASYIASATLSGVKVAIEEPAPYRVNPSLVMGIWSPVYNQWVNWVMHTGAQGQVGSPGGTALLSNNANSEPNKDAKSLNIALMTGETQSYPRRVIVGQAVVELTDQNNPEVGALVNSPDWVDQVPGVGIGYAVSDPGLGVHHVRVTQPNATGGARLLATTAGCAGTAGNPCPLSFNETKKPLNYEPNTMPQGINEIKVQGLDPIERISTAKVAKVRVDHSSPGMTLSGTLTEQGTVGVNQPAYTLKYNATDGDEAAVAALSSFGGTGTAPGKTELPIGVAVEANGNVLVVDRSNKRVSRFDKGGNYLNQFGTPGTADGQINDPTGIAVSPTGLIWVVEQANKRAQAFSSAGQFLGKITCSCFAQPYAIAAGPNGAIWISDIGADKLFKFAESGGTLLATAHGRLADPAGAATDMLNVTGIAVDAFGGVWAADYIQNKLFKFDANGNYYAQFGTQGSGDGQVKNPAFVTIAPSGNLMVVDYGNSRLQEFKPDGTYMRKFGSFGSGLGQMDMPQGPAFGPNGVLYVPDYNNHRVNRWDHADLDPQSGVREVKIEVDGQAVKPPHTQSCDKTCPLSGEWTLDADDYAAGQHVVKVTATDGVKRSTPKTLTIETHGDRKDPLIALSGSMTEQASLGSTLPRYTLKVNATDPTGTGERQSGVASAIITVDGKVVDSTSPGCPSGGCSISREWTLDASPYQAGQHQVEIQATDAAGRSSAKSLTIDLSADKTAPTITAANAFYNAPEGWVEQKSYAVNATGKDESGYGVVSMTLKIDGVVERSSSQACQAGGCSLPMGVFQPLSMTKFSGGAHTAELRAEDGAGNVAKRVWTVNVDPSGQVSTGEAERTVEALEGTTSANLIGEVGKEEEIEGLVEGLEFIEGEGGMLYSDGSAASSEVETGTGPIVTVATLDPTFLEPNCLAEPAEHPGLELSGGEEEELDPTVGACSGGPAPPIEDYVLPVEIEPEKISPNVSDTELTEDETAAVTANLNPHVDLLTRPLYEGSMSFAMIRDSLGPESFSWTVRLGFDQVLQQVDDTHAVVMYEEGAPAFTITAQPAHDAVGTAVPTSLLVTDGNTITYKVHHRAPGPTGAPFVYPVVGGAGWQGGFMSTQGEWIVPEEATQQEEESGEYSELGSRVRIYGFGTPLPEAKLSTDELNPGEPNEPMRKKFRFTYCHPNNYPGVPDGHIDVAPWDVFGFRPGQNLPHVISECWREDFNGVRFGVTVHGRVHMVFKESVWLKDKEWDCDKWGPEQPAEVECQARYLEPRKGPLGKVKGPIRVVGYNRWRPTKGEWGAEHAANCLILGGELFANPRRGFDLPIERPIIFLHEALNQYLPCPWKKIWEDGPGPS